MYIDFKLNDTGDLLFMEKSDTLQHQKISFNLSKTKSQKITFNIYDSKEVFHNSNQYLKAQFIINKNKPKVIALTCNDKEEKIQLITLKLKTCLGDLPQRKDFGSKLSLYKHENINSKLLESLEIYLKSILDNDIAALSIQATPIIDYENGYKQTVQIDIFSNDELLLNYKIEG